MSRRPSLFGAIAMGALVPGLSMLLAIALMRLLPGVLPGAAGESSAPVLLLALFAGYAVTVLLLALIQRFSWPAMRARYGLAWPAISIETLLLASAGTLALAIGSVVVGSLFQQLHWIPEGPIVAHRHLLERALWRAGIGAQLGFVFLGAVLPGFSEELLFRGQVQRGLLAHWAPPAAILVTSAMFAAWHLDPSRFATTFLFSCWVGWIAWRAGSIVPGMILHAIHNAVFGLLGVAAGLLPVRVLRTYNTMAPPPLLALALVAFGVAAVSALLLRRRLPRPA
jgi:membrane protease YdiL (CAAX protease family)